MSRLALLALAATLAAPVTAQTVAAAASPAQAASPAKLPDKPKLICRTNYETGSLVKRTRTCATADEWRVSRDGQNANARRMVQDNSGQLNGQ